MNGTMKYTINMRSAADKVKGQGVGSAYEEQVELVRSGLADRFEVLVNGRRPGDITHYHTLNPTFFMEIPFAKAKGVTVEMHSEPIRPVIGPQKTITVAMAMRREVSGFLSPV